MVWRILFQLGGIQNVSVLPDNPTLTPTENKYNTAASYRRLCSEFVSTRRLIFGSPTARITVWGCVHLRRILQTLKNGIRLPWDQQVQRRRWNFQKREPHLFHPTRQRCREAGTLVLPEECRQVDTGRVGPNKSVD